VRLLELMINDIMTSLRTALKRTLCKIVAIMVHYFILTSFFWTNVMAWDIYQTFGKKTVVSRVRPKKFFFKYALYALGMPFLIVTASILVEFSDLISGFELGYGEYLCWIGEAKAAGIFLALPICLILTVNVICYVKTVLSIRCVSKLVKERAILAGG